MELAGIQDKIDWWEKEAILYMRLFNRGNWRKIKGMALLQKSIISWLKNDDESTTYFYATIKERQETNGIYELVDDKGN